MATRIYKELSEMDERAAELSIEAGRILHMHFPVGEYPFVIRDIASNMIHPVLELNNVCRNRKEFRTVWNEVSEALYEIACVIVDKHIQGMNKEYKTDQHYEGTV